MNDPVTPARILCVLALLSWATISHAQVDGAERKESAERTLRTPRPEFEAEVVAENAFALSGPGVHFYPTHRLYRNEKVIVHGAAVGDYFAILPPKGRSFSWAPASAVRENADGTAEIAVPKARIFVGSELAQNRDARHVFQVELEQGARVAVVDKVDVDVGGKNESWYKILPPDDEVRYIAKSALRIPGQAAALDAPSATPAADSKNPSDTAMSAALNDAFRGAAPPAGGAPNVRPAAPLAFFGVDQPIPPAIPISGSLLESSNSRSAVVPAADSKSAPPGKAVGGADAPTTVVRFGELRGDFRRRAQDFGAQLDRMQTRLPESWDLRGAAAQVEEIERAANSPEERSEAKVLRERLQGLERQSRLAQDLGERFRQIKQRDKELEARQRVLEAKLKTDQPRFTAAGVLKTSRTLVDGRVAYELVDERGARIAYVLPVPGLNLSNYVNRRVGIIGDREPRAAYLLVRARQLVPDPAPSDRKLSD